jgi:kynurenine formamidase
MVTVQINGKNACVDLDNFIDISIPLQFNGPQPNAYGVDAASAEAWKAGDIVGDTRLGGSCNFEKYTLIPHCNGTHTECVGHITHERISVTECLKNMFVPAALITVQPEKASETNDTYEGADKTDTLITRASLEKLSGEDMSAAAGLIIRTLPNDTSKLSREYKTAIPPFFSTEAMNFIADLGVKHLLVDLPSIDRLYDNGKLLNHRLFWNVEAGSFERSAATKTQNTITELIYVPNDVKDGRYLLNLGIAPFVADASPSRPLLFAIEEAVAG